MENQPKSAPPNEIDLGQLFNRIGNWLIRFVGWIMFLLRVIKSTPFTHKKIFAPIMLLTIAAAFAYHIFAKKFYDLKVVISNQNYSTKILEDVFDNFNELADQHDTVRLSELLKVPISVAKSIKKIEVKPLVTEEDIIDQELLKEHLIALGTKDEQKKIVDDIIGRLKLTTGNTAEIMVYSYDVNTLKEIEKSILDFLVSTEYVRKRYDIYRENLVAKKERLFQESLKLDSLKKVVFENYSAMAKERKLGSNNVILADKGISYPLDLYSQDLLFYDQVLQINHQLAIRTDFEVISYFVPSAKPANYRLRILIPAAIAAGLLLSYLVVALIALNAVLSKVE